MFAIFLIIKNNTIAKNLINDYYKSFYIFRYMRRNRKKKENEKRRNRENGNEIKTSRNSSGGKRAG